jgi:hypothetical protein
MRKKNQKNQKTKKIHFLAKIKYNKKRGKKIEEEFV